MEVFISLGVILIAVGLYVKFKGNKGKDVVESKPSKPKKKVNKKSGTAKKSSNSKKSKK